MRVAVIVVVVSLTFVACRRETAQPPAAGKQSRVTTQTTTAEPLDVAGRKIDTAVQTPLATLYTERTRLGSEHDKDGHVVGERTTFKRGDRISLSMWLKESPPALQTSAIWYKAGGEKVHEQRRNMKGEMVVTFTLDKPLPRGEYRVEGYWGGNVAAEHKFKIE